MAKVKSSSYFPMAAWIFLRTSSLVTYSLKEMLSNLRQHLISKGYVLFPSSAVKVPDSQAFRNMAMTREHTHFTFSPRHMLPSLPIDVSLVQAAVACSTLERTSSFEPSSDAISPRYLKCVCSFSSGCHWRSLS